MAAATSFAAGIGAARSGESRRDANAERNGQIIEAVQRQCDNQQKRVGRIDQKRSGLIERGNKRHIKSKDDRQHNHRHEAIEQPLDLLVQLLDMVENSISLCKSSLGWFFRQWSVRTSYLTVE